MLFNTLRALRIDKFLDNQFSECLGHLTYLVNLLIRYVIIVPVSVGETNFDTCESLLCTLGAILSSKFVSSRKLTGLE